VPDVGVLALSRAAAGQEIEKACSCGQAGTGQLRRPRRAGAAQRGAKATCARLSVRTQLSTQSGSTKWTGTLLCARAAPNLTCCYEWVARAGGTPDRCQGITSWVLSAVRHTRKALGARAADMCAQHRGRTTTELAHKQPRPPQQASVLP